jgi:hypothetical protein
MNAGQTTVTVPQKPTMEMLIAGSLEAGLPVSTVAKVYSAMVEQAQRGTERPRQLPPDAP